MVDEHADMPMFLELCALLTGFDTFALRGTGHADAYLGMLGDACGASTVRELLEAFRAVRDGAGDPAGLERGLRREILSSDRFGPVARRLIKLWYAGTWHALPDAWHEIYGTAGADRTFVAFPTAYTEGLLWPAIGANPAGAKPLGYGTWASPPQIPSAGTVQEGAT